MFLLFNWLNKQRRWSFENHGNDEKTVAVLQTIYGEVVSTNGQPKDVNLWIRIIVLALEGALRQGFTPHEICEALEKKQIEYMAKDEEPLEHNPLGYLE